MSVSTRVGDQKGRTFETILDAFSDGTFGSPALAAYPHEDVARMEAAVREVVDQCAYWVITTRDDCRRLMNRVVHKLDRQGIRILPWYACMRKLKDQGAEPARFVFPPPEVAEVRDVIRDQESVLRLYADELEPHRAMIEDTAKDKPIPGTFRDGIELLQSIGTAPAAITDVIRATEEHIGVSATVNRSRDE